MTAQIEPAEITAFKGSFEEDVPAHMREDVLQRIVERAWSGDHVGDGICILSLDKLNQLNIDFNGTIEIDGVEHEFHIRDGNNNGTEIISWNEDSGFELQRSPPLIRALIPMDSEVRNAIFLGNAAAFLSGWNRDLDPGTERGAQLHDLPSKHAYDIWATGSPSRVFGQIAERYGYRIGDREEELELRRQLHLAELRLAPTGDWPPSEEDVREVYETWRQARDPKSEIGKAVGSVRDRVARRMAEGRGLSYSYEEGRELAGHGFRFVTPAQEARAWSIGLAGLFSPAKIEGFDRASLPEDPVRSIFAAFFRHTGENPNMDSRVDPVNACAEAMSNALVRMGREKLTAFPEDSKEQMAIYGYRLIDRFNEPAPAIPEADELPSP